MLTDILIISSTPDIIDQGFIVPVFTGSVQELGRQATSCGFDGLEFMPNPEDIPDADKTRRVLANEGSKVSVVNSGRVQAQGYALLHRDAELRRRSIEIFKDLIEFAGQLEARVGLGMARGFGDATLQGSDLKSAMYDIFGDLALHAESHGTVVMLEPADAGIVAAIGSMTEAADMARSLSSPGFSVMLDSLELWDVEASITEGVEAAQGLADHIQLYDPGHLPPGILTEGERLDWDELASVLTTTGFVGTGSVLPHPDGNIDAIAKISADFLRRTLTQPRKEA